MRIRGSRLLRAVAGASRTGGRTLGLPATWQLCTVADAHAAVATQAGVEVHSSRLVLSGCELIKPDELLYDAGYKSSRSVLYLQVKRLMAEDGGSDSEWLFEHS